MKLTVKSFIKYTLEGGCTMNFFSGVKPEYGYCVAVDKYSVLFTLPDNDRETFVTKEVKRYIISHISLLLSGEFHLGSWIDGQELYLELVKVVQYLPPAKKVALMYNQKAIYSLRTKQVIWLDEKRKKK